MMTPTLLQLRLGTASPNKLLLSSIGTLTQTRGLRLTTAAIRRNYLMPNQLVVGRYSTVSWRETILSAR